MHLSSSSIACIPSMMLIGMIRPVQFHWQKEFANLGFHYHVFALHADRKRLGLVRTFNQLRALLDRHSITARAQALRIAPRLAGADIELPRVPRAADDLAAPRIAVFARLGGLHQSAELAVAQAAALVR